MKDLHYGCVTVAFYHTIPEYRPYITHFDLKNYSLFVHLFVIPSNLTPYFIGSTSIS